MRGTIVGILAAAALAACAHTVPSPETVLEAEYPLTCKAPDECALYWRRAQVWLAMNSDYRIQSVTDTVITTHGPLPNAVERGYQVVRVPRANGRDQILITSRCANIFGCSTDRHERAASFKLFVRGGN